MTDTLHIVQLHLDRRALARSSARHRQPSFDEGYVLHAGLAELFATSDAHAEVPLRTFAVVPTSEAEHEDPNVVRVLGYVTRAEPELRATLAPEPAALVHLSTKKVPPLAIGTRASFRVRVCPTVRTKSGDDARPVDRKGRVRSHEIDAFIHATLGLPKEQYVSRETVYVEWLRRHLKGNAEWGGATLDDARLVEFRRVRTYRERKDRREPPEKPDALLEGTLTVTDAALFRALLARGVGRHRSFGFGMLLLRPAR